MRRIVARDDARAASGDLRCLIAVFGHGDGVPEGVDRVRPVLAAGTPDRLRPKIAVQAALSAEPEADAAGTLYVNSRCSMESKRRYWAFKPRTPVEVVEDIYIRAAAWVGRPVALWSSVIAARRPALPRPRRAVTDDRHRGLR